MYDYAVEVWSAEDYLKSDSLAPRTVVPVVKKEDTVVKKKKKSAEKKVSQHPARCGGL